jgi:hypothetical protein
MYVKNVGKEEKFFIRPPGKGFTIFANTKEGGVDDLRGEIPVLDDSVHLCIAVALLDSGV